MPGATRRRCFQAPERRRAARTLAGAITWPVTMRNGITFSTDLAQPAYLGHLRPPTVAPGPQAAHQAHDGRDALRQTADQASAHDDQQPGQPQRQEPRDGAQHGNGPHAASTASHSSRRIAHSAQDAPPAGRPLTPAIRPDEEATTQLSPELSDGSATVGVEFG